MKKFFLLALVLVASMNVIAQSDIDVAKVFATAPRTIFPLLDTNTRLDMVDYFKSGMSTPSQNILEGKSQITELTSDYLNVNMTDSSTSQLALFNDGKQGIVALINTVATPGLDSTINFYLYDVANGQWGSQATKSYFTKPGWKEWLTAAGKTHQEDVEMQVPFMLVSYKYDPSTRELTLTNNLDKFLDKEIYDTISPYLLTQLIYTWNGSKFALKK